MRLIKTGLFISILFYFFAFCPTGTEVGGADSTPTPLHNFATIKAMAIRQLVHPTLFVFPLTSATGSVMTSMTW